MQSAQQYDPLDDLAKSNQTNRYRLPTYLLVIGLFVFGIWSNFALIDQVSIAQGTIVPLGSVRTIQHLEGGVITEILVQEGEAVEKGDSLLVVSLSVQSIDLNELEDVLNAAKVRLIRAQSEIDGIKANYPQPLVDAVPEAVAAQKAVYKARVAELQAAKARIGKQEQQKQSAIKQYTTKAESLRSQLKILLKQVESDRKLAAQQLIAQNTLREKERKVKDMEGDLKVELDRVSGARAGLREVMDKREEVETNFRKTASEEVAEIQREINRLQNQMVRGTEQQDRTTIRSPIDGVVQNLSFVTLGGVVRPGEAILDVVPTGESLVVNANLDPIDRGYVAVGQPAIVKISAYDFVRYGGLSGTVTKISPNTHVDEQGIPFYKVIITTKKTWLGKQQGDLPISPGMLAEVNINTGHRTVLEYFLKPVLKLRDEAFKER